MLRVMPGVVSSCIYVFVHPVCRTQSKHLGSVQVIRIRSGSVCPGGVEGQSQRGPH